MTKGLLAASKQTLRKRVKHHYSQTIMSRMAQFMSRTLPLMLLASIGACGSDPTANIQEDMSNPDIEEWFDFSTLNDPPPKPDGPKVCEYSIRMSNRLLEITRDRSGGLKQILTPCGWTSEGLNGYISPDGGVCAKNTNSRFDGLFVSGPNEVLIWDLSDGCYAAGISTEYDFQITEMIEREEAYRACFRTKDDRAPNNTIAPAEWGMTSAAVDISFWKTDYGVPVAQIVTSEDTVEVVIWSQYPAWKSSWDDVLFSWLVDFGYEPNRVDCALNNAGEYDAR